MVVHASSAKGLCSLRIVNDVLRFSAIVIGLGLIFAWLGVYASGRLPFFESFVFWTSTMAVGVGTSVLVAPFIWGPRFDRIAAIFKIGAAATLISVPVTLVLILFFNNDVLGPGLFLAQFAYVLVISLIVTSAAYVRHVLIEKPAVPAAAAQENGRKFLDRLPAKYRAADLYAVSSEDHYLRVHTSVGEELILMRLADAVRELADTDGLQIHRSWWVAADAITDEKRLDGRSLLILPTGTEAPVSRSYRAAAKARGLIR